MKKHISIFLLSLAGIIMLAHVAVPHHCHSHQAAALVCMSCPTPHHACGHGQDAHGHDGDEECALHDVFTPAERAHKLSMPVSHECHCAGAHPLYCCVCAPSFNAHITPTYVVKLYFGRSEPFNSKNICDTNALRAPPCESVC